jgi:hypothetical protein
MHQTFIFQNISLLNSATKVSVFSGIIKAAFTIASMVRLCCVFRPNTDASPFSIASVLRLYAAFTLRLRHFDEMNMFNFLASACSNFDLRLQLRQCCVFAGSEKRSADAAWTQFVKAA